VPTHPPAAPQSLSFRSLALFAGAGLVITFAWTLWARTEVARAYHSKDAYSSIVALVDGSAPAPFVRRRLYPDLTRLIAASLPARAWEAITHYMT
jgi:hypothetical protein